MTGCGRARDEEARECAKHEGLAISFARRAGMLDDDGLQAARIGVLRAVRGYDETRGVAFSTYAAFWIRAELQRELKTRGLVQLGQKAWKRRRQVEAARERLGAVPVEELAAAAGVSVDQARAFEALGGMFVRSLWERGRGHLLLEERLDGEGLPADASVLAREWRERLEVALEELDAKEPRWGLVVRRRLAGVPLGVIGVELGVTRQRVAQLQARGVAWLGRALRREGRGVQEVLVGLKD